MKLKITESNEKCKCCKFVNINGQTKEERFIKISDNGNRVIINKQRMKDAGFILKLQ